jgi:hypothetical protein
MMTTFSIDVDDRRVIEHLESIPDRLRTELLSVEEVYKNRLVAEAKTRAPVKTGAYLASIVGIVYGSLNAVTATVRAGDKTAWYAAILEHGATLPQHEIYANAKQAMHFTGSAGEVFAKHVHFPGAKLKERDILTSPFEEMRPQIEAALSAAVDSAVAQQ